MKKEYLAPELDCVNFSFEDILDARFNVSNNESGGSDHNDDNEGEW